MDPSTTLAWIKIRQFECSRCLVTFSVTLVMNSPFPGLDPWLEQHWGDVHARFMVYACDQIADQLPDDLQARIDERLSVDSEGAWRSISPDLRVVRDRERVARQQPATSSVATEPCWIPLEDEPETLRHIEIVDQTTGGRVITAVELLSPTNKVGRHGRNLYLRKQREYLKAGVNLVEIDLLRQGRHIVAVPRERLPEEIRDQQLICVRRCESPGAEVYGVALRRKLPNIAIPLRLTDADVVLSLQEVFDSIYQKGRYERIEYRSPPVPPLKGDDANWAAERIKLRLVE